jgi:phosphoglycolate phosphatase
MANRFDLIVFDMDGTLVDTRDGIAETVVEALGELGFVQPAAAEVYPLIGLPLDEVFRRFLDPGASADTLRELSDRYRARYREVVMPRVRAFAGVPEGLRELRLQNHQLAVATSRFVRMATDVLSTAGLLDAFDLVLGMDLVARPKPAPDLVIAALERLAVPASRALVVGDTVHDIEMGRSAGATTCAVTYGVQTRGELVTAGPSYLVDSFDQLLSLLAAGA